MSWAASPRASPSTVSDLLEALRASGVDILYSSDLVPPDLAAPSRLHASDPLSRVREALALHHLLLSSVGPGRYLVTRAPEARTQAAGPNPGTPPAVERDAELQQVTVFASRYSIPSGASAEPNSSDERTIGQVPGADSDTIRALRSTPGLASNLSSRPYIRGAAAADTLIQFDGITLVDPFHFTSFQNLLSVFDPAVVQRADIYTGGFPARYGTRSAGVIDLIPQSRANGSEERVGASLLTYDASTVGRSDQWPVDWLASARHGTEYNEVLQPVDGSATEPIFSDALGRVRWFLSPSSTVSLGWLLLDDTMMVTADESQQSAYAHSSQANAWFKWDWLPSPEIQSSTSVTLSHSDDSHGGSLTLYGVTDGTLADRVSFTSGDLRTEWTGQGAAGLQWDAGAELGIEDANLAFQRKETIANLTAAAFGRAADATLNSHIVPRNSTLGWFASVHRRWRSFEAELGMRLDAQDYAGYGPRSQLSPRLNARYDPYGGWHLYASWGVFTQAQRVDEYRTEDDQSKPDAATRATHLIVGISSEPAGPNRWRLEIYRIHWTAISPYYTNFLGVVSLLPELEPDWVRIAPTFAESAGIELSARRSLGSGIETWGSYTFSSVTDDIAGQDVPRGWDQRNAVNLGLSWTAGTYATSMLLGWHSGWPRTPISILPGTAIDLFGVDAGARNTARWSSFYTIDLHAARTLAMRHGELSLWLDATNATDRRNECCVDLGPAGSSTGLPTSTVDFWSGLRLNVGATWRWRAAR